MSLLCRQFVAATSLTAMLLTHFAAIMHVGCHFLPADSAVAIGEAERGDLSGASIADRSTGCCSCRCEIEDNCSGGPGEVPEGRPADHDSEHCALCKSYFTSDAPAPELIALEGLCNSAPEVSLCMESLLYTVPSVSLHSGRGPPAAAAHAA